jgi:hypothetical protein
VQYARPAKMLPDDLCPVTHDPDHNFRCKRHLFLKKKVMDKELVYRSFETAVRDLRIAEDELFRPDEDAVTMCACNCTRNALNGFLKTFLLSRNVAIQNGMSSDELLACCALNDQRFIAVNLAAFACRHQASSYCLSIEKVNNCYQTTCLVKDIVLSELESFN